MKFGIVSHALWPFARNVGDDIQALAAGQLLPRVDVYLERERLDSYNDESEKIFAILNGWFMLRPETFPAGASIIPLITSIFIRPDLEKRLMNDRVISYFKEHQPIGCRNFATRRLLKKYGIETYFSGCLTMTLKRESFTDTSIQRKGVFLVDLKPLSRRVWASRLTSPADWRRVQKNKITHILPHSFEIRQMDQTADEVFKKRSREAHRLLSLYANARLVITSKLHAALPCLALGTPVLFVGEKGKPRFSGLLSDLSRVSLDQAKRGFQQGAWEIDGKKTRWDEIENGTRHLRLKRRLKKRVALAVQDLFKNH